MGFVFVFFFFLDHAIQVFLHSCFYSLSDTKNTITSFYSIRRKIPEVFSDRDERVVNYGAGALYESITINNFSNIRHFFSYLLSNPKLRHNCGNSSLVGGKNCIN